MVPRQLLSLLAATTALASGAGHAMAQGTFDANLALDPAVFTTITVTLDGAPLTLRRYEATYVGRPVAMAAEQPARRMGPGGSPTAAETQTLENLLAYQSLYVFVPEGAADTAAMILNVNNGGWFASELRAGIEEGGTYVSDSDTDKVGAALAAGYVYVDVGTRGRGILAADGTYPGHAPAAVVDTKAAIRWLRLNDAVLPGSAERIVLTGTSGGGGLTSVVAASGDSDDYLPYLAEIGAAGVAADGTSTLSDAVFAAIAYCPITDLGNADMAYEWLYGDLRSAETTAGGQWTEEQSAASATLAAGYPAYLASLGLTLADGTPLTAETMHDAIAAELRSEVERRIASGETIPTLGEAFALTIRHMGEETQVEIVNDWLDVRDGAVAGIDMANFLRFVTGTAALKPVPAFDRSHNTGNDGVDGENTLFGAADQEWSNFTPYGWNANDVAGDGSGADDTGADWDAWIAGEGSALAEQVRLVNPMAYLGTDAAAAPYWYVRHGMIDRDTSFAVEIALSRAIAGDADVREVSFALPWMTPHSGNYDVQEAYGWLAGVLVAAGAPAN